MQKLPYPYLNLSIKNIKGEKWKDIPGLEGYYTVSNFGRIKRLEYEMLYRNGLIYLKQEKIIKPAIVRQFNNYKQDYTSFLVNRVKFNGIRYNLSIARLVYHCFVENFDLSNNRIILFYKDGDSLNIRPSNLRTATLNEKQRRISLNKRTISPFSFFSKKIRQEIRKKIVKSVSKQVTQFTIQGKRIRTYKSMAEAERVTGVFASAIGSVASGKALSA